MAGVVCVASVIRTLGLVFPGGIDLEVEKRVQFEVTEDPNEVAVYMTGAGLLAMDKKLVKSIKKIAKDDKDGTVFIGFSSIPKLVEFPERHGPAAPKGGWSKWVDLSPELKNKIHETILGSVTKKHIGVDLNKGLNWAYASKKNYRDFMPMLYANVELHFRVTDFDFGDVIKFVMSISIPAAHALLSNGNLHIYLSFSTEDICDCMFHGTLEWLDVCVEMNQTIQTQKFNGVRIPWKYHAHIDDMVLHIDWETEVMRWRKKGEEWDTERHIIKEALHAAPLRW